MAAERAPAFQWYPKDFLSDGSVMRMSMTERGVYITLLSVCWLERDLPSDMRDLARIVGIPAKRFARIWEGPLSACFQPGASGRLTHKRLEKERTKQEEHRQRSSDRGKAGASGRWGNGMLEASPKQPASIAQGVPSNDFSISDLPSPVKNKEHRRPKAPPDPRVREFVDWFKAQYKTDRNGADYVFAFKKHGAIVKDLLAQMSLDRLQQCARIMLSEKCQDPFIIDSDRGIGMLATKINWLNERLAAWEARQVRA